MAEAVWQAATPRHAHEQPAQLRHGKQHAARPAARTHDRTQRVLAVQTHAVQHTCRHESNQRYCTPLSGWEHTLTQHNVRRLTSSHPSCLTTTAAAAHISPVIFFFSSSTSLENMRHYTAGQEGRWAGEAVRASAVAKKQQLQQKKGGRASCRRGQQGRAAQQRISTCASVRSEGRT
jgi:hypothetical protein